MLLHAADAGAALAVGDACHIHAANGNSARLRLVQAQQKLEHRALARTGAAHQRDLPALLYRHGEITQDGLFAIAEGHMRKLHIPARSGPALGRDRALRLSEKGIDALDTCHGRLDGLDLHAKAFNGSKNAGNVVDDRHRGTHRHPKECKHHGIAGSGKQHHDACHHRVQRQHHRRIDGIVKIGALHSGVALADAAVIAAFPIAFQPQRPDGADVVQRLRHLTGDSCNGTAVIQLCGQHPLLHMAGEHRKQRQHQQQHQRNAGVFYRDDRHDGNDAAGICRHADDAGGEQRFHRVHIAGKACRHLAGVLACQRACGQPSKLPGHFRPQRVGHFLAKEHQQAFLRGGKPPFQRQTAKVKQHCCNGERDACGEPVNDTGQQQRRQQ